MNKELQIRSDKGFNLQGFYCLDGNFDPKGKDFVITYKDAMTDSNANKVVFDSKTKDFKVYRNNNRKFDIVKPVNDLMEVLGWNGK